MTDDSKIVFSTYIVYLQVAWRPEHIILDYFGWEIHSFRSQGRTFAYAEQNAEFNEWRWEEIYTTNEHI